MLARMTDDLVPRAPVSPVAAYLKRLPAEKSRAAMRASLICLARIVLNSDAAQPEDVPWRELGVHHVDAIVAVLADRYAPASANRHLSALRGLIKTLVRMDALPPERAAKLLDFSTFDNKRPLAGRVLSMEEIGKLFAACQERFRDAAILALAYGGGLRRAEIAELQLESYFPATGIVRVTGKGGKIREVPLPAAARAHLREWLERRGESPDDKLLQRCAARSGKSIGALSGAGVYAILERMGERAGVVSFTPHDLRRTFITELLARGVDVITTARIVGHEDTKTTMLYDRRPEEVARAGVALLAVPMPLPTLDQMFTPQDPRGDLQTELPRLRRLLAERLITVHEVALSDPTEDDRRYGSGGGGHHALCAYGAAWLKANGYKEIHSDSSYFAGRFDLASADRSVFVECGDTPSEKVVRCCENDRPLLLIPYDRAGVRGYLFKRAPDSAAAWAAETKYQKALYATKAQAAAKTLPVPPPK